MAKRGRNGAHDDEFREIVETIETRSMSSLSIGAARVTLPPATGDPITAGDSATPTVAVIVPTLNEARNLALVLPQIAAMATEVIVVDGRSMDHTVRLAELFVPNVRVIQQTGRGKGDALRCGIEVSSSDIIVLMDADGSTDPQEIPRFVQALRQGADYAKGTRYVQSGGSEDLTRLRSLGNRLLTKFANIVLGSSFTDLCYGYNAFWRIHSAVIPIDCGGFEVEAQLNARAVRAHLNIAEVPSYERTRIHGASSLHPMRDGLRVAQRVLKERFWTPPAHAERSVHVSKTEACALSKLPGDSRKSNTSRGH